MLKAYGFPTSLSAKKLPRCQVGTGKGAVYYMWKDEGACQFLGGKLAYQTTQVCKTGKPHTWARVTRCVQGPVLTHKGLDYKTGKLANATKATTTVLKKAATTVAKKSKRRKRRRKKKRKKKRKKRKKRKKTRNDHIILSILF